VLAHAPSRQPDLDGRLLAPLALLPVTLGVAAVASPLIALVATAGVLFVAVAWWDLAAGTALFTVIAFLEALPAVAGTELGAIKIAGVILVASALRRSGAPFLLKERPALAFAVVFFATWMLCSALWAEDASRAVGDGTRLVLDLALLFVVFAAVRDTRDARLVVWGYLAGAAVSSVLGYFVATYAQASERLAGGLGQPDFLAAMMVPAIVLSMVELALVRHRAARMLLWSLLALFTVSLFLTQSRGGLVALAVAIVSGTIVGGRIRRYFALLAMAVLAVGGAYVAAVASQQALDRLTSPGSGTGRLDLWSIATQMVADHPYLGVGAGNFEIVAPQYASRTLNLPYVHLVVDRPHVAHNTYLGVLAELGIVGLVAFGVVVMTILLLTRRATRLFARISSPELELVSRGVLVSLLGLLAAFVFLSGQLEKELWLLLGLGVALEAVARRSLRARAGPAAAPH
jgi:O-antigen ligase